MGEPPSSTVGVFRLPGCLMDGKLVAYKRVYWLAFSHGILVLLLHHDDGYDTQRLQV